MRVIKTIIETFRAAWSMDPECVEPTQEYKNYEKLHRTHVSLLEEHWILLDTLAAEREQKERYRTAFLSRMNVPVIGKAWTGDDYSEDGATT
jgi:hypothetical protein